MSEGIAIVTPVLNERSGLPRMIDSVLSQTVPPGLHLIVDGGSLDGSYKICTRYAAAAPYPVRVVRQKGEGLYTALNEGMELADAPLLGVLNANDRYASSEVLSRVSEAMAGSDADLLYGDIRYERPDGSRGRLYSGARFRSDMLRDGFMPPHPSIYIRRELWDAVGPYRTSYRIAGDFDWLVRALLIKKARGLYLPMEMVLMNGGGVSARMSSRLWRTPCEKWLSLRANGCGSSPLRLLKRYFHIFDK
ncbi:MAG: glycosyltransferase [Muribaculaceae bacterium]|nr:glycosyltransferase [Muribaculaceae bacterium]